MALYYTVIARQLKINFIFYSRMLSVWREFLFNNDIVQSVNDVFCNLSADDAILYAIANEMCKVNGKLQQNVDSWSE